MANVLSKNNILTGEQVEAWNITQSIDAFTGEVEYDILLSGSFTLTGSLYVDGDVLGTTTGTASTSDNTEYTLFTPSTDYTPLAEYNESDYLTLQFYNTPLASPLSSISYMIAMGEPATLNRGGITLPIDCYIREAYVSISTETPGSPELGTLFLISGSTALITFSEKPSYDEKFVSFVESIDRSYPAGTSLAFRLTTPSWAVPPSNITHNITLKILPR